jgi:hypothetical protein
MVRKDFETQFLANVAALPQVAGAAQAAGPSRRCCRPSLPRRSRIIPAVRRRARARLNMRGWWYAETAEDIFLSDIRSATGKGLVRELRRPARAAPAPSRR